MNIAYLLIIWSIELKNLANALQKIELVVMDIMLKDIDSFAGNDVRWKGSDDVFVNLDFQLFRAGESFLSK